MPLSKTIFQCVGWVIAFVSMEASATNGIVSSPNCNYSGFETVFETVSGSGGGTITFSCGASPVTIAFSDYLQAASNLIIDGGNKVTFDGGGSSAFFQIFVSGNLTLKNLTLQHGVLNASHALENFGALALTGVFLTHNTSSESPIVNSGSLTITSSEFDNNSASPSSNPAGVITSGGGTVSITSSTFTTNSGPIGGAIDIQDGSVVISNSTFSHNTSNQGGAIDNDGGTLKVSASTFSSNQTNGDGGAIDAESGQLSVDQSQFTSNDAGAAGAGIACSAGNMTITNSAFGSNDATTIGGGVYSLCAMTIVNATFNNNKASGDGGGAIYQAGSAASTVEFATIADNTSLFGGGVYNDGSGSSSLSISKSIVAANSGGNCDGVLISGGYNLADDTGCGGAFGSTDLANANLPLGTFSNNGGKTSTMLPTTGNNAIDFVPRADCGLARDQRLDDRPAGSACDAGAVELNGGTDGIFADGFGY